MRLILSFMILMFGTTLSAAGPASPTSYWLLMNDGGQWCGFRTEKAFQNAIASNPPTESVRATVLKGRVSDLTYQVQPESGDWIVVDRYVFKNGALFLKRASLLTQEDIKVLQEGAVPANGKPVLRTLSVTTLEGAKTTKSNIDYPAVTVFRNLSDTPFTKVLDHLEHSKQALSCSAR